VTPNIGILSPSKIRPPAIIAEKPTIDPTDKSMPPLTITKVIPIAKIAIKPECFPIRIKVVLVKKLGVIMLKIISRTIRAINVLNFKRIPPTDKFLKLFFFIFNIII